MTVDFPSSSIAYPIVNSGTHNYRFLQTEVRQPTETLTKFVLRRINEELAFFGSLAAAENRGCKLELTTTTRHYVRATTDIISSCSDWLGFASPVVKLPNNVFCFSGTFGYPSTAGVTRLLTGAAVDDAFITNLTSHFEEITSCIQPSQMSNEDAGKLCTALQNCIDGLHSYIDFYRTSKASAGSEIPENYTFLCTQLEQCCDKFSKSIRQLNESASAFEASSSATTCLSSGVAQSTNSSPPSSLPPLPTDSFY